MDFSPCHAWVHLSLLAGHVDRLSSPIDALHIFVHHIGLVNQFLRVVALSVARLPLFEAGLVNNVYLVSHNYVRPLHIETLVRLVVSSLFRAVKLVSVFNCLRAPASMFQLKGAAAHFLRFVHGSVDQSLT